MYISQDGAAFNFRTTQKYFLSFSSNFLVDVYLNVKEICDVRICWIMIYNHLNSGLNCKPIYRVIFWMIWMCFAMVLWMIVEMFFGWLGFQWVLWIVNGCGLKLLGGSRTATIITWATPTMMTSWPPLTTMMASWPPPPITMTSWSPPAKMTSWPPPTMTSWSTSWPPPPPTTSWSSSSWPPPPTITLWPPPLMMTSWPRHHYRHHKSIKAP